MLNLMPMTFSFDARRSARAVRVPPDCPPQQALAALRLAPYHAIIILHGGAGNMEPGVVEAVRQFLAVGIAPLAQRRRIMVVDGGTAAGAMTANGDARAAVHGTYPLVGVAPVGTISYPGGPAPDDHHVPLDPSHSHFIFVEGQEFGVESPLLVGLLRASHKPGLALIINGGEIVFKEVLMHAEQGNTMVVVRGSGRAADDLADPHSERRARLPATARLEFADIHAPDLFAALVERLLFG